MHKRRKHKFCFRTEKAANLWFQYLNCTLPYCIFLKNLSNNECGRDIEEGMKETNSELLANILKEEQAIVEIDDQEKQNKAKVVAIEDDKEESKEETDLMKRRETSRSLMKALEEDGEIFRNDKDEENIGYSSFTVLEKIGEGGFGQVFKVKLNKTNEIFAMKSISKNYLLKTKQLRYAQNECKILREMNHPFVIKMHYAFQTPQYLYFVLDYCEGGDLSIHIANKQVFEEYEAKFYVAELILAIEYLHSKDIIYRDLKPENVLLCNIYTNLIAKDGHLKLSDFGLAKQVYGNGLTAALSFCGSPAYLTPEMLLKKGVSKPLDIYGIGTILYELLVGIPPYYDEDIETMYENIAYGKLKVPKYVSIEARSTLKVSGWVMK